MTNLRIENGSRTPAVPSTLHEAGGFKVGDKIKHDQLGIGRIQSFCGQGAAIKVSIDFGEAGTKKLMLQIAAAHMEKS
jgi:hypothetical protein